MSGVDILALVITVIVVACIVSVFIYAVYIEPKQFNKGICPKCGTKLRCFDTDSSSARGYCCDNCDYTVWVSWGADKKFK